GGFIPNTFCRPLGRSQQKMFCGRFSTSGDVLLTASQDSRATAIIHYSENEHKMPSTIRCLDTAWSVISTDFSPDEKWLAYSSWSPYVHLCNTRG
ncbi:unnamed protein product, partial [Ectocarpus fasciculatus]